MWCTGACVTNMGYNAQAGYLVIVHRWLQIVFTRGVKRLWQLKSVKAIPVVVGALGTIPKKLELYLEKRGTEVPGSLLQKVALLGTAGTLRQVFGEDVGVWSEGQASCLGLW